MTDLLLVTGDAPHADRWHDLPATSAGLAAALAPVADVTRMSTSEVDAWPEARLILVNASGPDEAVPGASTAVVDALARHSAAGRPILATHSSSIAFADDPRWRALLGGRWVHGTSFHPAIGDALVEPAAHPAAPPAPFRLYDERYTDLDVGGVTTLATHEEGGAQHPLAWWHEPAGCAPVVYLALGHGVEAYTSPELCAWLRALATTLLAPA